MESFSIILRSINASPNSLITKTQVSLVFYIYLYYKYMYSIVYRLIIFYV